MRVLVVGAGGVGSSIVSIAARREVFEQIVVADVDLDDLQSSRIKGTTIPLHDKRRDVYAHAVEIVTGCC